MKSFSRVFIFFMITAKMTVKVNYIAAKKIAVCPKRFEI